MPRGICSKKRCPVAYVVRRSITHAQDKVNRTARGRPHGRAIERASVSVFVSHHICVWHTLRTSDLTPNFLLYRPPFAEISSASFGPIAAIPIIYDLRLRIHNNVVYGNGEMLVSFEDFVVVVGVVVDATVGAGSFVSCFADRAYHALSLSLASVDLSRKIKR